MTTAVILGGAASVWDDLDAYQGPRDGVIACNDIGAMVEPLDAWCTLHPEYLLVQKKWLEKRREKKLPDPPAIYCHASGTKQHGKNLPGLLKPATQFFLPGCKGSGSTGMLAVCVALYDMGFDDVVLCGVPVDASPHYHNANPWRSWEGYQKIWGQIEPDTAKRIKSMSGWTRQQFGTPEAALCS